MKITKYLFLGHAIFICIIGHTQKRTIKQKVDSLISIMTLDEKIGQLNQYSGKRSTGPVIERNANFLDDIRNGRVGSMLNVVGVHDTREIQQEALKSRLKIPLIFGLDVIHGFKTIFPIPIAEACSWDLDAMQQTAHIAAMESSSSGIHWTFAPMLDIATDPRWGRIMEGAGEDPYLGQQIAKARINGFQGNSLEDKDVIMACAKHFVAYGATVGGRDYAEVEMSKHDLYENYLPPFKGAVEANVATFMSSFNTLNGVPTVASNYLQRNILKGDWKYPGFIVSDWGAIDQMIPWGYVNDKKEAAYLALEAGCDMDMMSYSYIAHLKELVTAKKIKLETIDEAVARILIKKYELGLFDNPFKYCDEKRERSVLNDSKSSIAALEMAEKSAVLLKNDKQTLPINKAVKKIALIGPLSKSKRNLLGNWSANNDTTNVVSLYDGLLKTFGQDIQLKCIEVGTVKGNDTTQFTNAIQIAKDADLIIMALGENFDMSGEAKSKAEINLPGIQEKLFKRIQNIGKPIVSIIMAGRPLVIPEVYEQSDAVIYAWWLGEKGGAALANILVGNYNPSAKLVVTIPRTIGQIPLTYKTYKTGHPNNNKPSNSYRTGYIDIDNRPQYAFGHGLSYTHFTYSNLVANKQNFANEDSIKLNFIVKNDGDYDGDEIIQLYINDPVATTVQPTIKLKKFQKIKLNKGASQKVEFTINKYDIGFFDDMGKWKVDNGVINILIGAASDDIRLKQEIIYSKKYNQFTSKHVAIIK